MTSTIYALPAEVVHLITAGEVIDSLASVVRELVENSLDAGATRIVVSLWPQQWRVRVADNGYGMTLEDLQKAATAHSTSKISSCADLWKITSLGFRGEALHSLTTLADLEILSRPLGGDVGVRVVYGYAGERLYVEACAIAPGTVVTVSNLFGNCSGRREALPTLAQQMKAVQATIYQIALCHPHVTWQVWQNDREWFSLCSATSIGQLLPQILHQVKEADLQELKLEIPHPENSELRIQNSALHLVIGLPDRCHRHRPDWVRVAVNGRMVKSSELEQTILSGFYRTLPRDRFPVCLLHLFISPEYINWNRNPAKSEIYLNQLSYWQEQISTAIAQALRINSTSVKDAVHTTRVGKLLKAAEEKGGYNLNRSLPSEEHKTDEQTSHTTSLQLKAVAQVNNTYIVAEHPGGVWLVEQHIAHERVLYEQLCDNWKIIPIEPPVILYQLSPAQVSQLQRIGLDIETFGEQLWAVRSVPALLQQRDDCADAILELSWGGDLQAAQVAVACRSAIRNGTTLSLQQMQTLLDEWQRTRNPRTCPHGRPIYLSLEESALARFFKRHWVIGKSHGI
ncbi:DNA mismatch repair endonuclease MutL [Brasilonema sp. UFV-L1]|uniref:DNA mismatch repair endonuclease MutL n=1 Tax=Brasilonema sp. UFV-L1 TaxID=2234130 RepID=UPI00145EF16C|nr:DNA mismatch repair endonuclease MutL [Brasilonema sp. UFV-L1]NMG06148.1 DNA mismatch repair endonuclease MutL [Brasilonema sp. UFV-L1]